MSRERESDLVEYLKSQGHTSQIKSVVELLNLRREKHRSSLEAAECPETRGRAKECKKIIEFFVDTP